MFTAILLMVVSAWRILQNQTEDNYRTRQKRSKTILKTKLTIKTRHRHIPFFSKEKPYCVFLAKKVESAH